MNKFREFYPFDFLLLNENGEHGFYIQDSNENIRLSVLNKTDKDIGFKKIPEKDFGINNFHFMLRFRPGTIVEPDKIKLKDNDTWSLVVGKESGQDLLCFRNKTNGEGDPAGIERYRNLDLQIDNLMADHTLGSRDSNVELLCDNIVLVDSMEVLRAARQVKWPIISHRGNPRLPLHVGFVGSNTILNNGEPNTLTLRIFLINPKKESLKLKHDLNDSVRSKIIITFDTGGEKEEWAISKSADHFEYESTGYGDLLDAAVWQAREEQWEAQDYRDKIKDVFSPFKIRSKSNQEKTKIYKILAEAEKRYTEATEKFIQAQALRDLMVDKKAELFEKQLNEQAKPAEMIFSPSEKDILMGNSEGILASDAFKVPSYFDIKISEIKTIYPSGTTNCYVRFENIPGYWDHTFVCPIQKQPLVIRGDQVGIGKFPDANAKLDVGGTVKVHALQIGSTVLEEKELRSLIARIER